MDNNKFLQYAIEMAKLGQGSCFTNPLVGAVIVKDNHIIASGYHAEYGKEHAEINAINQALLENKDLSGATIYVTLEPCSHQGKTPPCYKQLIKHKFSKVVVGQLDPNPLVAGRGVKLLREANIETIIAEPSKELQQLYLHYNHFYKQQRPFITLKYATTFDGKATLMKNQRFQLTDSESLIDLYNERAKYQAILIGSGTQKIDDPQLTIRKQVKYPPIRILIDHKLQIKDTAKLFEDKTVPIYIFTHIDNQLSSKKLIKKVNHPLLNFYFAQNWTATKIIEKLSELGVQSLFIEGGPTIEQSFINSNLIDQLIIYQAPFIFGNNSPNSIGSENNPSLNYLKFDIENISKLGPDIKIVAKPKEFLCLPE